MQNKRVGTSVIKFDNPPKIIGFASVGGKKEKEGPLADTFDILSSDTTFGQKTWEKAENVMQQKALSCALQKAKLAQNELEFILAGDLLNQCIGSSYAHAESNIPYIGLYGACSTMAEAICLSSVMIDGGFAQNIGAVVSSHFCSAERQYRYPLHYGGQRTQTAQWTVTGSGAVIITNEVKDISAPKITHALFGKIVDMGITDANNMGSAMAASAYDSLSTYFNDTNTKPNDYDLIITGDLGYVGSQMLKSMFLKDGIDIKKTYNDCGIMIYDANQDVHAGGSGCGCSASVLCSYILNSMLKGQIHKVLFCGTGALLSPISIQQGSSIPGICHIACIEI